MLVCSVAALEICTAAAWIEARGLYSLPVCLSASISFVSSFTQYLTSPILLSKWRSLSLLITSCSRNNITGVVVVVVVVIVSASI